MTEKVEGTGRDNLGDVEERLDNLESGKDYDDPADNFLSEFVGVRDIEIKVYAKSKGSRKMEYLFATDPDEHTMGTLCDHLRDTYGGGEYQIHVRDGQGLRKNRTIAIRAPLPGKESGRDSGRELAELERRMEDRAKQQENGLANVLQSMQAQTTQMMQAMQQQSMKMMEMMIANRPEKSGADLSDPNTLMALKTLFTPDQPQTDPTEMLMKGIELANSIGGQGKDTNDMDVLLAGIKSIAPGLTALASRQLPPPQPQPQTTPAHALPSRSHNPPAASAVTGSDRPAGDPEAQQVQAGMAQLAQSLMDGAARDLPPEQYVEPILDMMGPDQAYAIFSTREGRQEILSILPQVQQYSGWLDRLGQAIDEATAPEDDAPMSSHQGAPDVPNPDAENASVSREPAAGSVGDSPHAANHGETGTSGEDESGTA